MRRRGSESNRHCTLLQPPRLAWRKQHIPDAQTQLQCDLEGACRAACCMGNAAGVYLAAAERDRGAFPFLPRIARRGEEARNEGRVL